MIFIGDRIVMPSSVVFLVVKLRLIPPTQFSSKNEHCKKSRSLFDIEVMEDEEQATAEGYAHAPYWPGPSWWLVIADEKLGKVVVPSPYANNASDVCLLIINADADANAAYSPLLHHAAGELNCSLGP
ncbi:hypothetical protein D9758_014627 [Tetrapyrgos nigripes]|uniref:Uncharacterized protein n=1 Tax=Tetrapyrgos nigripes TaxID=182062 RepID=A0A8H5CWR8_9AGAR|nr:hypothetical protein D9758_014627 [Tetrapyrgos nigripes]